MAERKDYYDSLVRRLQSGDPLSDSEIRDLAFAYGQETKSEKPSVSLAELKASLPDDVANRAAHIETFIPSTGSLSTEARREIETRASTGGPEPSSLEGIAAGALGTAGIAAGSVATGAALSAIARIGGTGTLARLLGRASGFAGRHKGLTGATVGLLGGSALFGAGTDGAGVQTSAPPPTTPNTGPDPSASQGNDPVVMWLPDPETGAIVPIHRSEMGPEFQNEQTLGAASTPAGLSPDLQGFVDQAGLTTSTSSARGTLAQLDPTMLGDVSLKKPIDFTAPGFRQIPNPYPSSGGASNQALSGIRGGATPSVLSQLQQDSTQRRQLPPGQLPPGFESIPEAARGDFESQERNIPVGAEINPKIAQVHNGRTLIEWASAIAHSWGVPLNLLYGLVNHESGWNPIVQGDNGQSHGLVQIYQPAHGDSVTIAQSRDPVFALNWAAKNMRAWYDKYGRWDVAVAQHNSPVAAEHLAKTGEFYNAKSKSYVSTIMDQANRSGLDNWKFDTSTLSVSGEEGAGSRPAFVTPDPATLRQFIRESYTDAFGRMPTQEELEKGVAKLNQLYRSQFDRSLAASSGADITTVDPASQFVEGLEQSGEGQFMVERTEQRSFMDFASEVARLLQSGL